LVYDQTKEQEGYTPKYSSAKGLLTGTRTYLLDNSGNYTTTALYYDDKGQIVQSRSTNHLQGYDIICNCYNFTGQLTKTLKLHKITDQAEIRELYTYTFDNAQRPLVTTYSINGAAAVTLINNTGGYDEVGRLITKKRHNNTDTESFTYNIRSWLTRITSGTFQEQLYYNTLPTGASISPCYNGNIAYSVTGNTNSMPMRSYAYTYDNLNRLTGASGYYYTYSQSSYLGNSESFFYDKMGNINRIVRTTGNALMDNLSLIYNGNQIKYIDDSGTNQNSYYIKEYQNKSNTQDEFSYDANGNMIKDLDRDIVTIKYNLLNLPDTIQFKTGDKIVNTYSASGQKLKSEYYTYLLKTAIPLIMSEGEINNLPYTSNSFSYSGTAYIDNKEYNCNKTFVNQYGGYYSDNYTFNLLYNPEGYVTGAVIPDMNNYQNGIQYNYYRRDHLGNNREVWRAAYNNYWGTVAAATIQRTQYYPSGLPWAEGTGAGVQQKKYNGKEFVEMHGYDTYDYGAREMYPAIMRFTTPDPLAEKYYSISPYAYCANNPVKFVDLDGREVIAVSKEAQKMILNTLPKEVRQYITFDKNGYINHENIKNIKSNTENFNSLKLMVLSENRTVKVEIDNKFFYKDQNGNIQGPEKMTYLGVDKDYIGNDNGKGIGTSTGETGFLGKTLFPDNKGLQNSINDNIIVIVNSNLSEEGKAQVFAHEGYGHAYVYVLTNGDRSKSSHNYGTGGKDLNRYLYDMINRAINETIQNMK